MDTFIVSDERFERRWHRLEQTIWVVLSCLLAASAVGAFGHGGITRNTAVSADGKLTVQYDRVLRAGAKAELVVFFEAQATKTGRSHVRFSSPVPVRQITPSPMESVAGMDSAELTFRVQAGYPARVLVIQAPDNAGRHTTRIADLALEQIVLP